MKHLLVDHDGKIPNLALMQLSAWLKSQGHETGLNINDPDEVWVSCIFKKNKKQVLGIKTMFEDIPIHFGGSGIDLDMWLPKGAQKVKPDYDLYPSTYSMGFTSRGCIRACPFCIVREKEGYIQKWMHISEFYDDRFDTVELLDNNILALPDWFYENAEFIIDHSLKVIDNGMDIRLLTFPLSKKLKEIKWASKIKFAWDFIKDKKAVEKGITLLKETGFNVRGNVMFYVLVGYNTTPVEDLYRCNKLKEMGTNPFVMQYKKNKFTKALARWANRKETFWSMEFKEYEYGGWTPMDYIRVIGKAEV